MVDKKKQKSGAPKKRIVIIAGSVLAAVLITAGVYYFLYANQSFKMPGDNNQFVRQIKTMEAQPVPADPIGQAIYYAQFAQNYDNIGDIGTALSYYLKAQKVIDDHSLADQIVYYQAIADDYKAKKDSTNERKYLQLQLNHVQSFLKANPDDAASKAAEQALKDRLSKL